MSYDTREVKELCDPLTIVESLGLVRGKQHGDSIVIKCPNPEHTDNNPSCRVSRQGKVFHCFSCHAKGDIIELVKMATGNRDHGKALEYIASVCGLPETNPQKKADRLAFVLNAEEQDFVGLHEADMEVNKSGRYIDRNAEDCSSGTKHLKMLQELIREDPESAKLMVLERLEERMKELLQENIVLQNRMLDCYFRRSSGILTQEDEDSLSLDEANLRDNLATIRFANGIYRKIGKEPPSPENILLDGLILQNKKVRWDLYYAKWNKEDTIYLEVGLFCNVQALTTVREIYGIK